MESKSHGMVLRCAALLLSVFALHSKAAPHLQSAVLPTSRAVEVGTTANFFATIINDGDQTAINCRIELPGSDVDDFAFQQTAFIDNAPVSALNEVVDIPPGESQSFALFVAASQPLSTAEQSPVFVCDNASPAASLSGINTFDFASSTTPVPDVIALAATQSADGRLEMLSTSAVEAFVVAVANLGLSANLEFSASLSNTNLPLELSWCVTDELTSLCQAPPISDPVPLSLASDATASLAVFVASNGLVSFQPATNRIVVNLTEAGVVLSRASVAPFTNQLPQRVDGGFGLRGGITGLNDDAGLAETGSEILQQGDGKIVVAGRSGSGTSARSFLVRFNTDGSRDQSFTFEGAPSSASPVTNTLMPDGSFLLANGALTRFSADGSPDLSFGVSGTAVLANPDEQVQASFFRTALLPDGDIIVAGRTDEIGVAVFPLAPRIWRFSADGVQDENFVGVLPENRFGPGTLELSRDTISSVAGLASGKILIAGSGVSDPRDTLGGVNFERNPLMVARFLADGTLDPQFADEGVFLLGQSGTLDDRFASLPAADFVVLVDGSVVVLANGSGFFGSDGDSLRGGSLVKLTTDGTLDPQFGVAGVALASASGDVCSSIASALYALDNGQFIVAGSAVTESGRASATGLQRYTELGELDTSFGDNGCFRYSHSPGDGRREQTVDVIQSSDGGLVVLSNISRSFSDVEKSRLVKLIEVQ